jgi:hypothetical protein
MDIKEYVIKEIINASGNEELTDEQKNKIEKDTQVLVDRLKYLQKLQESVLNSEESLQEFIKLSRKHVSKKDG